MNLREDANEIIKQSIQSVLPDTAIREALLGKEFSSGKLYLIAVGKAAWQMASAAVKVLDRPLNKGIVITKYDHVKGEIPGVSCYEAGHPIPDENSFLATEQAISLVQNLKSEDTVLFLLSGGGSALFEKPLISADSLRDVTNQLMACGADIVEINCLRKRLSAVKGGKFAKLCEPAQVYNIVLSDILGDPLDMIGSGPTYPDSSSAAEALAIVEKYDLKFNDEILDLLALETPKELTNIETKITGSVRNLCNAAQRALESLGYEVVYLTDQLACEAKEAGSFLAAIAKSYQKHPRSIAFLAGGETIVRLTGKGLGGRNQEIALSGAAGISGLNNTAIFSIGSDGTDGPTDAAGGYCDQDSAKCLKEQNINIYEVLKENDSYHALEKCDGLIKTGPTGTNVNDLSVLLIKR
ncbi:MAG TPA: glycerate kinase [Candidatus Dorea intestinavium]|nr:glycerate kinase [Candidatus Dorea intestinavium]